VAVFTTRTGIASVGHSLAWLEGFTLLGLLVVATGPWWASAPAREPLGALAVRLGFVGAVCFVSLHFSDLYDFEAPHDFPQLFSRLCRGLGASALVLAATYLVFPATTLPGNATSHVLIALLPVVLLIRGAAYSLAKRAPLSQRVLLMGAGSLARDLAELIRARPDLTLRLVGVLAGAADARRLAAPRLGGYQDVGEVVRRARPDRIIVALPDRRGQLPVAQLLACRVRGVRIEEGALVFERLTRRLAVESLTPSALIFGDGFRVTRAQLLVKRVLSVAIALTALAVGAPFMALVALAIRLESAGPAFFVQERVGLHGRVFRLVKFRTMRGLAGPDTVMRDNASRVTRLGAVLRRYRLDEFPQFINILRGDMSLVGPRPEIAANVATFSAAIPYYDLRHEVRPGLTGWAQVRAGYSMSLEEVTRKLCYDLYYIKHMSIGFDLRILVDTVKFVLSGKRPG
jgi:exopolysaccharide biosynthesis polyprenyl glycosylphosphotransferase